jgi:hypothetical protein
LLWPVSSTIDARCAQPLERVLQDACFALAREIMPSSPARLLTWQMVQMSNHWVLLDHDMCLAALYAHLPSAALLADTAPYKLLCMLTCGNTTLSAPMHRHSQSPWSLCASPVTGASGGGLCRRTPVSPSSPSSTSGCLWPSCGAAAGPAVSTCVVARPMAGRSAAVVVPAWRPAWMQ